MIELCRTIIKEGRYSNLDPVRVAEGLNAMSEGLWLDILISPHNSSSELSKQTLSIYMRALFPKHFPIVRSPGD
jgi:TetR/AcrR family transcriptional repressor of bet genes